MSKIKIELDEESFLVLSEMLEDYSFRYADFLQKHGINSALDKQLKLQTKAITVFQTEFYKNKEINFIMGAIVLLTAIIGSYFGSKLVLSGKNKLSNKSIKYISAIFSIFTGILFLISAQYENN